MQNLCIQNDKKKRAKRVSEAKKQHKLVKLEKNKSWLVWTRSHIPAVVQIIVWTNYLFRPLLSVVGTIYSNGFFLFRQFWPIDIFIVES